MVTFSFMAGIFHEYYTVALAPAIAALVGMGATQAWEHRGRPIGSITLAAATAAAAGWSFVLLSRTDWQSWLRVGVLVSGLASALLLLAIARLHSRFVPLVVAGALVAALAGPAAYSAQTVSTAHTGSIVTAGPSTGRGGPGAGGMPGGGSGGFGFGRRAQAQGGAQAQGTLAPDLLQTQARSIRIHRDITRAGFHDSENTGDRGGRFVQIDPHSVAGHHAIRNQGMSDLVAEQI
jgi:hypothetical protein